MTDNRPPTDAAPLPGSLEEPDEAYRARLSPTAYQVARQKGTERPFSGEYWDHWAQGAYRCRCCNTPLFSSEHKFDAGCGWPSYFATVSPEAVREARDLSHGMIRTEILCAACNAHLGHVFPDGPEPTGLRYCVNSVSVSFSETDPS